LHDVQVEAVPEQVAQRFEQTTQFTPVYDTNVPLGQVE